MTSAFIKAMHNKPKLFDDEASPHSNSSNSSSNNNTTTTETVTFSSSVPDRHRNETRQVSEAMFGSARSKQKSAYSAAESAAQIEQRLRNREIGVRGGNASTHVDDAVASTTVTTTTITTTTTAPIAGKSKDAKAKEKHGSKSKGATPDEVFRHLRSDPVFLDLKRRFDDSRSAADALACAKHLVGVSSAEAEKYFKEALACDPSHLKTLATYAVFLETIAKDFDHAEKLYQAAAMSGERVHIRAYAAFLRNIRGDDRLADKIERAGSQADANDHGNDDLSGSDDDGGGAHDDGGRHGRRRHHRRHHRHG